MNIFKAWKIWRKLSPIINLVKEGKKIMDNLAHNLSYSDESHLEHTSTLKHTSKGLRIWIENST